MPAEGPSGAAAAWQAAQTGAKVVVLDKAEFPRDKPCGDGLTARAVSYLQKMGLAEEVDKFHRVNRVTVFSPSQWELSFPKRPGMPDHGYVARRPQLDTLLLKHAEAAGAEIRQSCEVTGPELDANGRVVGVVLKSGEKVLGDAVIAADGAYSPIKRALKIDSEYNGYSAIAIRAEMPANKPDSDSPRHLPQPEVQGRPAAGLRVGVPVRRRRASTSASATSTATRTGSRSTPPSSWASSCGRCRASGACRRSRS